ncbi:putative sugar phosphatase of HAD superfamily [Opitutaceae bacterium TAV1]|nr:putative sugar phosphatase of HAD superfamily [Opitutaceae bacterium TAV1]
MKTVPSISQECIRRLATIRHLALDMDGTLYLGSRLFPCTVPFLRGLEASGIGFTFLTNNSSRSRDDYLRKLKTMGVPATPEQLLTSTHATADYLRRELPGARRLFVLGTPGMQCELGSLGFLSCEDEPDAVLVGFDMTLGYERLCRAAWWISQGRPFIASHPDLVCPTDQPTVLVDCGSICRALESATGISPVVIGKPDPRMLAPICARHNLRMDQVAMIGDRLTTDVAMARASGALAVLVLTGEATLADIETLPAQQRPDLVVEDVGELGRLIHEAIDVSIYQYT